MKTSLRHGISLGLALASLTAALAGCGGGGSGAALQVVMYPSDRGTVTNRRLESLARQYEADFGCTATDTITVQGIASLTYSVDGCGHVMAYQLACRAGVYTQICDWNPVVGDLMAQAATDMNCQPDTMDAQAAAGMARTVMGCGLSATYMLQCMGVCSWQLAGPISQTAVGGMIDPNASTVPTSGGSSAYITQ